MNLTVNGRVREIDADEQMPLLWVLRDLLSLTGTKFGCGQGLCGACTVHLDGVPVRSCVTPVAAAVNREVRTIEGLSVTGDHPLQLAWAECDVPQCGYCQPGQLMSAAALLERTPQPTVGQIREAMAGNLCRCGTYQRIRAAIALAGSRADGAGQ